MMKVLLDPLFSLLTLLILSFHSDPSTSSASSSPPPSLNLQNCTNSSCGSLPNISFPFSLAASPNITSSDNSPASCGLPEFRLICSSSSPSGTVTWWPESMHPLCSIRNITSNHASYGTFVTGPLSASPPVNACSPVQVEQLLSLPPPRQVGLEFFPQSNIVLLINCSTDLTANLRINDTVYSSFSFSSPNCLRYYSVCYQKDSTKAPCLEAISADANITHVKNTYGCTYNLTLFELPTKSDMALSLQMEWWISQSYYDCRACEGSNGNCSIDNRTGGFQCSCLDGRPASIGNICGPVQSSLSSCKGLCQSSVRIFLGVMAIAAAIVIGTAGLCVYYRWHNRQSATPCAGGGRKPNSNNSNEDKLKQMLVKEVGPFLESTQTFTYRELFEATNGFSEGKLLGDGGFATVFEGTLASSGQKVAVKRMYSENKDRLQQFLNEIRILVTLNHPNLVKLHGFCCESYEELLLVYEFAPNGSLADNLHGMAGKGLLWETRLCIALETARALTYLHQRDLPILHRDVKSSNILLDENFHAKLGDFGLSRQVYSTKASHISTAPQGTPGYVDPQYHQCYQLTDKSDVYSFGVVLLELISGKAPVDMSRRHTHINLSSLAVSKIQTGALHELFDPFLEVTRYSAIQHMVKRVAELAFLCLAPLQEDRPSMSSVALALLDISESAYPPSSYTSPDSMSLFDKTWPNSTNSTMDSGCCSSSTHTDPDNVPSTATSPDLL